MPGDELFDRTRLALLKFIGFRFPRRSGFLVRHHNRPPPGGPTARAGDPCGHEVRREDQEDETDGTDEATTRFSDEPDESLLDYPHQAVRG